MTRVVLTLAISVSLFCLIRLANAKNDSKKKRIFRTQRSPWSTFCWECKNSSSLILYISINVRSYYVCPFLPQKLKLPSKINTVPLSPLVPSQNVVAWVPCLCLSLSGAPSSTIQLPAGLGIPQAGHSSSVDSTLQVVPRYTSVRVPPPWPSQFS